MPEPASSKTNATALAAFGTAILGYTCFWGVGGLAALVLGLIALREIDRSEGRQGGKGLSVAAVVLGGLNLAGLVVLGAIGIATIARPSTPVFTATPGPPTAAPALPSVPPHSSPRVARPAAQDSSKPPFTRHAGVSETLVGGVRLIDVAGRTGELWQVLGEQQRTARSERQKLLLFIVSPHCLPCNGVSLALPDARLQAALAGVRVVRVDATEHSAELTRLGVPTDSVPGFALLTDALRPRDYVHGGEWDADIPENIAPVLRAFVAGTYAQRRHSFREPQRPDETSL